MKFKYLHYIFLILLTATFSIYAEDKSMLEKINSNIHGFLDVRGGMRVQDDPNEKTTSLAETRLQLSTEEINDLFTLQLKTDILYDDVTGNTSLDLYKGTGPIDLREANITISPLYIMDIKAGRQILTWGTGDLLFINDLFPKDWQSFFNGRDEEYLKAPSDAIFISLFPSLMNINIAYTPKFNSDRYIRGDRISYWNPMLDEIAGRNAIANPDLPDDAFSDDELAIRLSKNIKGFETALYGYHGLWKSPKGYDPENTRSFFPELSVYGASLRTPLEKGLLNLETGYYSSENDHNGTNPFIPNSEIRALAGFERELFANFTASVQYYVEHMCNYSEYRDTILAPTTASDEDRQVITLRLTSLVMNQNLVLSLFTYYSPTDEDAYLRPIAKYKVTDALTLTAGSNLFMGRNDHTFFGQFRKNNNVYGAVRYSF